MKKKHIATILLIIGILLLCVSIVLAVIETRNKDTIGGADFPTFVFVFFRENKGIYFALACLGIISLIASVIVRTRKTMRDSYDKN